MFDSHQRAVLEIFAHEDILYIVDYASCRLLVDARGNMGEDLSLRCTELSPRRLELVLEVWVIFVSVSARYVTNLRLTSLNRFVVIRSISIRYDITRYLDTIFYLFPE